VLLIFQYAIVILYGLIAGSFATALVWRIPRLQTWALSLKISKSERSRCPHCQHRLGIKDLVPILSFVMSKARCRYCQKRISARYPLIEICTVISFICVFYFWGGAPIIWPLYAALPFFIALFFIDIEHFILPNILNIFIAILGALFIVAPFISVFDLHNMFWALGYYSAAAALYGTSAFLIGFFMSKLLKKDALGLGDVKFFAVCGLWLGLGFFNLYLVFAGIFGMILGLFYRLVFKQEVFPFGPALILSFFVCILLKSNYQQGIDAYQLFLSIF
jgi:prepilin signal peptidase PulO-like enzyme (type II secretory pathway)